MLATGEHLGWRLRLLLWQDWAVLHADTNLDRRSVLWQVRLLTHQVRPGLPLRGWSWDFLWEGMWVVNYGTGSLGIKSGPDAAVQMIQDGRMLSSRQYRVTFFRTLSDLALDYLASFFPSLLTNPLQVAVPTINIFHFSCRERDLWSSLGWERRSQGHQWLGLFLCHMTVGLSLSLKCWF